ncbi:hypothetical protein OsJ_35465 [Oryza sativa Japonica Group]|uniref:Uncharacterized protein n=1 Tax=Oryza sativa subsp. japonica TaxID=39947 RepID=B9GC79_ORYSJ|nr:hypothetical protein OsJ_35465 [Oryza sativa Japonica Group]
MTVGGVELRGQRLLRPRGAAARVAAAAAAWSCCEGGCTARVAEAVVGESLCTQSPTRRAATAVELATPRGRDGPRRSQSVPNHCCLRRILHPQAALALTASSMDFMEKIELLEAAGEADLELGLAGGLRGREGWGCA